MRANFRKSRQRPDAANHQAHSQQKQSGCFIARSNVQEDVRADVLVAIPMADAQLRRDLALVFRQDKALSRAALAFIEIAKKHKSSDVWTSRSK
jgi:hypothetical protein